MPFITPKKTPAKAAAFVWDAFPPPPPEAETWQPDPNSIARPGGLPDRRFNRDPEQDRRSRFSRREAKTYGQALSETASLPSTNQSSLGHGLGQWPASAARSTGYPKDFVQDPKPTSPPSKPIKVLSSTHKHISTSTKPTTSVAGTPKGTMELMPAPNYHRPETKASGDPTSSSKSSSPDWMAFMDKAIAEDDRKLDVLAPITTSSNITARPESVRKKSIPPHLRNKTGDEGTTMPLISSAQNSKPSQNPEAKAYEALLKGGDTVKDEAMARETVSADPGNEHTKQSLRIQQEILVRSITKSTTTTTSSAATPKACALPDHDIKVKIMLIRAMEHELDLEKVAPERELMAMQRAELDMYYDKVCSAHRKWWEGQQASC
ncbi:hypothetical protein ACET3X_004828 [Alternaria dauci]|uniref:Uncharacterized protein n=1 Tax=Alternaria dauci TaxID=48095 RepID=A0ABR3UJR1_9PLEO